MKQCITGSVLNPNCRTTGKGTKKSPSLTPPPPPQMPLAIGDAIVQGLNAWNQRGLYCVRGGASGYIHYTHCALCVCLATRLPAFISQVERGDEINSPIQG